MDDKLAPPSMSPEMAILLRGQIGSIRLAVTNAQRGALENREISSIAKLEEIIVEVEYLERYLFPASIDDIPF